MLILPVGNLSVMWSWWSKPVGLSAGKVRTWIMLNALHYSLKYLAMKLKGSLSSKPTLPLAYIIRDWRAR